MNYIWWAIIAMGAYGGTAILLKLAMKQIPPEIALVITNTMLVLAGVGLVLFRGGRISENLGFSWTTLAILSAGVTLSVSVISYYFALSRGPASVVVPIFALNFAVAAFLAFLFLGESITANRVAGLILAAASIFLLTR